MMDLKHCKIGRLGRMKGRYECATKNGNMQPIMGTCNQKWDNGTAKLAGGAGEAKR
jgi:hypothetical protein